MVTTDIQTFYGDVEILSNLTVNANTLHIDTSSGRVGIGKTNPGFSLDVEGIINCANLYIDGVEFTGGGGGGESSPWTLSGSNIYYTTGNVGIGTSTPLSSIDIHGGMRISNVSDSANIYVDIFNSYYTTILQTSIIDSPIFASSVYFGQSVAISNDGQTAVIGSYGNRNVYIYKKNGRYWFYEATISGLSTYIEFSRHSIGISRDGSRIVVGSRAYSSYTGIVLIYDRPGGGIWTSTSAAAATILASDGAAGDAFGYDVAISGNGNVVVAGAYGDDDEGANAGAAYVIYWNGSIWDQYKIVEPDTVAGDTFGHGVSVSGDGSIVVVGAYISAKTYIYTRSGNEWTLQQGPLTENADSYFGVDLCISDDGNRIIVGASRYANSSGEAYIYTFSESSSSWTPYEARLTPPIQTSNQFFGRIVGISGDGNIAICGAYGVNTNEGVAYVFQRSGTTWSLIHTLSPGDDGNANDWFGFGVSLSGDGNDILVGSSQYDNSASNTGRAFFYNRTPIYNKLNINQYATFAKGFSTYKTFTGQHICFPCENMKQGLIVSANKNKYMNLNGQLVTGSKAIQSSESLPVVSLSNTAYDRNVFGVVNSFESRGTTTRKYNNIAVTVEGFKELGDDRVIVNSIGEGALWVVNTNGNLETGDYITTSNISGYGQKQDSDTLKNYTVAKITMDCDFNPPNISVQVIKKGEDGINVLDEYGRLQWEDTNQTQPAYIIRYLDTSGIITDQANAIWVAAYVGCTYHCG